jgi:DNA-binding response OmpR family regulator
MTPGALNVLGGFELRAPAAASPTLATRKSQALLVHLALAAGRPRLRGHLAALLWGRSAEEQARASLRQALSSLRKVLEAGGGSVLHSEGESVWLEPAALEVDALRFETLLDEATPAALEQAVDLYRGDFLAGFVLNEEAFEDWLMSERDRLRERQLQALSGLLEHYRSLGDHDRVVRTARRLVNLDPLRESGQRALMQGYWQMGRRSDALQQYEHCVRVLRVELGIAPEPATRELHRAILSGPPVDSGPATTAVASEPPAEPEVAAETVLVVDDDPQIRRLLGEYLSEQGYRVEQAADGVALRAALRQAVPDVVLLDLRLPGEDGLSLARYLREHYDVGLIMVTGAGQVIDRIVGLELGADDYLAKPFELRELLARIRSVIRRCRSQSLETGP